MHDQELYDRLVSRMDVIDGHWISNRAMKSSGYCAIKYGGRYLGVHAAMWIAVHGPVPEGKEVCHKCGIPPCIKPECLWVGTHLENMQDAVAKGRMKGAPPRRRKEQVCPKGHPLVEGNIYVRGDGYTQCLECNRTVAREYARKKRAQKA